MLLGWLLLGWLLLRWLLLGWLFLGWLLLGWLLLRWLLLGLLLLVDGHFWQVKNLPCSKTHIGETGCRSNFLGYLSMSLAVCTGFSDLWRSPPALSSTPATFSCLHFLIVQVYISLIHPLSQHSQLGHLWLPAPHCAALVCFSPNQPREVEDFPRGGNHSKHVPLLTYLAWLQPNQILIIQDWCLSMSKTKVALIVVKSLVKKHNE